MTVKIFRYTDTAGYDPSLMTLLLNKCTPQLFKTRNVITLSNKVVNKKTKHIQDFFFTSLFCRIICLIFFCLCLYLYLQLLYWYLIRAPQRGRPEPRCLFSPVKPPLSPPREQQAGGLLEAERRLCSAKKKEAQNEALRWESPFYVNLCHFPVYFRRNYCNFFTLVVCYSFVNFTFIQQKIRPCKRKKCQVDEIEWKWILMSPLLCIHWVISNLHARPHLLKARGNTPIMIQSFFPPQIN